MWKEKLKYIALELIRFVTNKQFLKNLLMMATLLLASIVLLIYGLRFYTNHGQKLVIPDYKEQQINVAKKDAATRTFEIIVNDSVYIVGKPGGIIQNQNPPGGSEVKKGRKIYVDITKYQADIVEIADALPMYGQSYELKKAELQRKSIFSEIKEFRYDGLSNNTILEVWNGNELLISAQKDIKSLRLPKGTTLSFVVSTPEGGSHEIPLLVGNSVKTARWMVESNKLRLGSISWQGERGETEEAEIISQDPEHDGISAISTGSSINITVKKRD